MKKMNYLVGFGLLVLFFTGCSVPSSNITKSEYYPKFYEAHPKSILVLPAVNRTTSAEATDHFRYTITPPLTEKGYYVFPVKLVDDFLKGENLSEAELIRNIPIAKLKEVFNADAVLYVDINAWDTGYAILSSNVDVGLSFSLVDLHTGNEIWNNNAYAYSFSGANGNNGLAGLLISAVQAAINTSVDYTKLSFISNVAGTAFIPYGKYHPMFMKDMKHAIQLGNVATLKDGRLYVDKYFITGNGLEEPVPLTARHRLNGYHAFSVHNLNFFNHNGYRNYYISTEINGKKYLRNRFFKYENNKPYLLSGTKKVFVVTESDGSIPYSTDVEQTIDDTTASEATKSEEDTYYFQVDRVVELKEYVKQ